MHRFVFRSLHASTWICSLRQRVATIDTSAYSLSPAHKKLVYRRFSNGYSVLYRRSGSSVTGDTNSSKVATNISPTHLFTPVPVRSGSTSDDINVGEEIAGKIDRNEMVKVLHEFLRRPQVKLAAEESGLDRKLCVSNSLVDSDGTRLQMYNIVQVDWKITAFLHADRLFHQSFVSFRKFVIESRVLPTELHIILSDISSGSAHVDGLFPFFLEHARKCFPHLDCMEDLQQISDLTNPANWYPEARAMQRKVIFHAGPTNSGKTYNALQRFMNSSSGLYCGPLRLLASEVYHKTNSLGTKCDLVTGEERKYASGDPEAPSKHVACTVEMVPTVDKFIGIQAHADKPRLVNKPFNNNMKWICVTVVGNDTIIEVAVLDEIQMLKDPIRGWAWTRALLGLPVEELHLCGEASAINMVRELLLYTDDEFEVCRYKRLTPLTILDAPLGDLDNVRDGDCIVCFSKNDIYAVSRQLDLRGIDCGVIYGGLPPGTKLAQARNFNDPEHPCNVLVATDAIGMGLNLSIKRLIFYSLIKPTTNAKGEKEMEKITTSTALQIAGRAGRYGSKYEEGEVTTFRADDLPRLRDIMSRPVDEVEHAGLHPTDEQIELFGYHLPNASLSNLVDIFSSIARTNKDLYFMCNLDDLKFLADMIQHVPLPLKVRYKFCCAPIGRRDPFVCSMLLKYARQFSRGQPLTFDWMCRYIGWPVTPPANLVDLVHLEHVFDTLDLYLWLGYRFADMFPDQELIRDMQHELDAIISEGVSRITKLIQANAGGGLNSARSSSISRSDLSDALSTIKKDSLSEGGSLKESIRRLPKKAFTLINTGTKRAR